MKYHTFIPRIAASIIDGILFLPFSLLMSQVRNSNPPINQFIVFILEGIYCFSSLAYNIFFHVRCGQTPGKMFTQVKLMDISEERPPKFYQAFIREIGYIISSLINLVLLIYFLATNHNTSQALDSSDLFGKILVYTSLTISFSWLFIEIITTLSNSKRRAFHDYIANTVVVKTLD